MPVSKKVDYNFFEKWNPEMTYVLGFFLADGSLTASKRNNYYLTFYSADRDLLESVKKVLNSSHKLSKRSTRSGEVYRIQIGSKKMFEDLLSLGLLTRKSSRLKLPNIPKAFFAHFVRGYFDGDGNVWVGTINNQRKISTRVLQVSFTSGCGEFLSNLLSRLRGRGVRGGSLFKVKNKNCERLTFSTLDALKLYRIMYNVPHGLYLRRKKEKFEEFVKMRS